MFDLLNIKTRKSKLFVCFSILVLIILLFLYACFRNIDNYQTDKVKKNPDLATENVMDKNKAENALYGLTLYESTDKQEIKTIKNQIKKLMKGNSNYTIIPMYFTTYDPDDLFIGFKSTDKIENIRLDLVEYGKVKYINDGNGGGTQLF
ncbi:hypothetical protein [Bacillus sp. Brlt_9]|uniref:hypothetical protein n=1 Tax=Bacillus sp. Brlt_9 TaxID=3110916 RepID=UPI003F7C6C68